jgi:hypothetical protein
MTSREHARRLLLVLLSSERRDGAQAGTEAGPSSPAGRGRASGARAAEADGGSDAVDATATWTAPPSLSSTARSP